MGRLPLVAAVAGLLLAGSAAGARTEDSRDPSEGAPATTLGAIVVEGGGSTGDGVTLTVDRDRRAAHIVARFAIVAAPGTHTITLATPPTGVVARFDHAPLALERTDRPCDEIVAAPIGIDPTSGARYPIAAAPPAPCEGKQAVITVGDSGRGLLELEHDLSAGYDRLRRRRTMPEVTHLRARRVDYFVYHFAVRGPKGPVTLRLPPLTDGTFAWDGDLLRVAATESRRWPIGLTVLVGTSYDASGLKLAGRVTLDALLPWGDVVALGVDGDHSLRLSTSLTYQLHSRWMAFLPIGGHIEAGAVLDVNPRVRIGGRLGLGGHFNWITTSVGLDLFDGASASVTPVTVGTPAIDWRIFWVSGIGF